MKNYKYTLLLLLVTTLFSCSKEDSLQDSTLKSSNMMMIAPELLVGEWKLSAMNADTLVDLNKDGTGDMNLLNESSCFNEMKVIFNPDFTFSTTNARLSFTGGTTNAEFVCEKNRVDFGTWNVEGVELILKISIDGTIYTDRKTLNYNTTTFAFDVSKAESNVYVSDPGDTSASKIRILGLEYSRI